MNCLSELGRTEECKITRCIQRSSGGGVGRLERLVWRKVTIVRGVDTDGGGPPFSKRGSNVRGLR